MKDTPVASMNPAEAREETARMIAAFRDNAGKNAAGYTRALDLLEKVAAYDSADGAKLYSDLIKTTEWHSAHTAIITPRLLKIFDTLAAAETNKDVSYALESLMSYARHHMADRRAVLEHAGETIVRRAETSTRHDGKFIPTLVTKLVDTARIYSDEGLLPVAFKAGWLAIAHMHPERADDCHAIAQRMYGVAARAEMHEDFIRTGRAALPEMIVKNRSAVITTARVLEQASSAAVDGRMFFDAAKEGFLTPAFARTGRLDGSNKERWFFPSAAGRWDEPVITMVPEYFESARQEMILSPNLSGADLSRINHVCKTFADMANGVITPERAAECIGVSADHLTLDAWK